MPCTRQIRSWTILKLKKYYNEITIRKVGFKESLWNTGTNGEGAAEPEIFLADFFEAFCIRLRTRGRNPKNAKRNKLIQDRVGRSGISGPCFNCGKIKCSSRRCKKQKNYDYICKNFWRWKQEKYHQKRTKHEPSRVFTQRGRKKRADWGTFNHVRHQRRAKSQAPRKMMRTATK